MLSRKIPAYYLFITIGLSIATMVAGYFYFQDKAQNEQNGDSSQHSNHVAVCDLNIKRLKGFEHIMPLIFAEPSCESQYLASHKSLIESVINTHKSQGNITSASVYLRTFLNTQWIAINETEKYSPGSLLKVPELITLYRMQELNPDFFSKKYKYEKPFVTHRILNFESKHIEPGNTYTVKDLIRYMIVYSDNEATMMLNQIIDRGLFNKVFSDVGLQEPDFNSRDYPMTAPDYSVFFKELFNGSYLSFQHSEECMKLLSETEFNDGMMSGLPAGCVAAHKFGEGGPDSAPNFSESALIYCGKRPYLLTVMTKGTDMKKLPVVVKDISRKVFEIMNN